MAIAFIHVCALSSKNLELEHGNNLPAHWLWQSEKAASVQSIQFHYQLANSQWQKDPLVLAKAMPIFASHFRFFGTRLHTHSFAQSLQSAERYGMRALSNFNYLRFLSPSLTLRLIDWLQPQCCTLTLNLRFENEVCKRQNSGQGWPGVCGGTQWNIRSIFGAIAWKMFNFRMNYDDASRRID